MKKTAVHPCLSGTLWQAGKLWVFG